MFTKYYFRIVKSLSYEVICIYINAFPKYPCKCTCSLISSIRNRDTGRIVIFVDPVREHCSSCRALKIFLKPNPSRGTPMPVYSVMGCLGTSLFNVPMKGPLGSPISSRIFFFPMRRECLCPFTFQSLEEAF